jgi:Protein of unknown function (DUF3515)
MENEAPENEAPENEAPKNEAPDSTAPDSTAPDNGAADRTNTPHDPGNRDDAAPAGGRPADPLRRAALIATVLVVPVVVVLVVMVRVLGGDSGSAADTGHGPAVIEGTTPAAPRDNLPVLPVQVPPVTPQADEFCPALMSNLPLELAGEQSRRVDSASPFAYAWGDPAVVLICGVDRPAGFVTGTATIQINGVQWYVDTKDPNSTVWTAVDRPVHVEVRLPADVDSAPVTALSTPLAKALPYREPTPGR